MSVFVIFLIVAISLVSGCGREQFVSNPQAASPEASSTTAAGTSVPADNNGQQLPFKKTDGQPATVTETKSSWFGGKSVPAEVIIPAGTAVPVRLQANVSSATSLPGQSFDAVLAEPLVINGQTIAAEGAPVVGRVVASRHSGRLHNSGYIRLTLASVEIKGKQVPVQTSSIFAAGGAHKKRNLALIGGGTGAGALIGAIAGGGKGALIGSAIGAAGGTTTAYATGKKDIGFGAERRLTFRLNQPITVRG